MQHPIGIFDSGYGGLTVLKAIEARLPRYDYLYLGDNARAPYGNRSFDTVYQYTLECVRWFFRQGCPLVVLACNTASAKALRTIQQKDLPALGPNKRVLGVIRPTAEVIGRFSRSGQVGVLATQGTVQSKSYVLEIEKFFPDIQITQLACPMWVPLVENNEHESEGADYFVRQKITQLLQAAPTIDTLLLACTHYPLLQKKIEQYTPPGVQVIAQGAIVADSLADYLLRHPEMEHRLSKQGERRYCTTDSAAEFDSHAGLFLGKSITSQQIMLLQTENGL